MNMQEWVNLGLQNGVICTESLNKVCFSVVYEKWFLMKLKTIKAQSCDRLECCYNRYYAGSDFVVQYVSDLDESSVSKFLTDIIIGCGGVSRKEYRRIYQIVNNVMCYAKDLGIGGARLLDWDVIKRYVPAGKLVPGMNYQFAVPCADIQKLMDLVINQKIYFLKQSACLCLMLNFYLGLRVGELASLTWRDVDFDRGVVRIHKTEVKSYPRGADGKKSGSMAYAVVEDVKTFASFRDVPLLPEAVYILQQLRQHHDQCHYHSPYLAYDGVDGAILTRSLDRTLRRICELGEVNSFSTHLIRKTFATMLHTAGVPTRYISDLLGHSEMLTTERNYILGYQDDTDTLRAYMRKGLVFERFV